jgi:putative GTP pyrophosphokinase
MDGLVTQNNEKILEIFDKQRPLYEVLKNNLIENIGDALFKANIKCHGINGRVKNRESLIDKITIRSKKIYDQLDDITDICGIRITTYFANDVDRVASVLEQLLTIDAVNSIDKRRSSDPLRFGYSSLHIIVHLPKTMTSSRGDGDFADLSKFKAEIQVRSILQHAWAEIEHDLGYKSRNEVPNEVKRRFARISGLLELADDEFDAIRSQIVSYSERINDPQVLLKQDLNKTTLEAIISKYKVLQDSDSEIASIGKTQLLPTIPYLRYIKALNVVGLTEVVQVKELLAINSSALNEFARGWFGSNVVGKVSGLPKGISLLFLFYYESAKSMDAAKIISNLRAIGIPTDQIDGLTQRLLKIIDSMEAES